MRFETLIKRADLLLISIGVLKMLLLTVFFASFAFIEVESTRAQSVDECKGEDLLDRLRSDDNSVYEKVVAEASATINANSIFWKLEKEGQQPSWLYGTMHMADPDIATIPKDAKQAILSSDAIVIETTDALDPQAMQRAMAGLAHLTFLKQGTLRDLVDDSLEEELATAVEQRGIPMSLADRMQPWLVATTISLPVCELQRKQQGAKVLDSALAEFGVENGKELKGLETVSEQLSVMASLPVEFHVSALEETLESGTLALDMIETMKGLYRRGEMGYVFPLMKAVMPKSGNSEGTVQFQEALIDRRNQRMLERSLPILNQGPAFIAVGGLHLPGEQGLVKLFRDAGYTVTSQR